MNSINYDYDKEEQKRLQARGLVADAIRKSSVESGKEIVLRPRTDDEFGEMATELGGIKERGNDAGGSIYSQFRVTDNKGKMLAGCDGTLHYWSFETSNRAALLSHRKWSISVEMPRLDRDEDAGARDLAARYLRAWRLRPARRR